MVPGLLYSLVRVLLDAIATGQRDQTELQAEVLMLRRRGLLSEYYPAQTAA